jgi:hypothetical protein
MDPISSWWEHKLKLSILARAMLEIDAEGPLQNSSTWNLTRSSNTSNSGQKIVVLQTLWLSVQAKSCLYS